MNEQRTSETGACKGADATTAATEPVRRSGSPSEDRELTSGEIDQLATYNSECARGLLHDQTWNARMAELQHRFNANCAKRAKWNSNG